MVKLATVDYQRLQSVESVESERSSPSLNRERRSTVKLKKMEKQSSVPVNLNKSLQSKDGQADRLTGKEALFIEEQREHMCLSENSDHKVSRQEEREAMRVTSCLNSQKVSSGAHLSELLDNRNVSHKGSVDKLAK